VASGCLKADPAYQGPRSIKKLRVICSRHLAAPEFFTGRSGRARRDVISKYNYFRSSGLPVKIQNESRPSFMVHGWREPPWGTSCARNPGGSSSGGCGSCSRAAAVAAGARRPSSPQKGHPRTIAGQNAGVHPLLPSAEGLKRRPIIGKERLCTQTHSEPSSFPS